MGKAGRELGQVEEGKAGRCVGDKQGWAGRLGPILGPILAKGDWIDANKHPFSCYLRVAGVICSTPTAEQSE